jgi:hypothetical protein
MGWRFRKSIRVGKGININLSNRGVGWSAGIPGSGLRYVFTPGRGAKQGWAAVAMSLVGIILFLGWLAWSGLRSTPSRPPARPAAQPAPAASAEDTAPADAWSEPTAGSPPERSSDPPPQ